MAELRVSLGRLDFCVSLTLAEGAGVEGEAELSETEPVDTGPPVFGFFRFLWEEGEDDDRAARSGDRV